MADQPVRLRRLIADELGDCRECDLERRLDELESLSADIPGGYRSDIRALKAIGSDTRYEIVRLLSAADGDLCVCELTPLVDVSESAVSHALSDLTDAGLVVRRKAGTWRYYDTTDRAERLLEALDSTRESAA